MTNPLLADADTLTATEARDRIRAGALTATEYAEMLLARVKACEPDVQAWTFIDPDMVRTQAAACDAHRQSGAPLGPLHGVPVGIKDIIDTADMPTQNGSDHFIGHQPEADSTVVAVLRAAGAVIMGKTVTTELATRTPGKSRNPHNTNHTPGGSSSGSAAAVAAGMVPLALGTQTGGSVVRPASFCGIHAIKPTRGLIPRTGVTLQSHTLDTVGTYGRTLDDVALLTHVLDVWDGTDDVSYARAPSTLATAPADGLPETDAQSLRFGLVKTPSWGDASSSTQAALEALIARLPNKTFEPTFSSEFDRVSEHHQVVQAAENTLHFGPLMDRDPNRFSEGLRTALIEGLNISAKRYQQATFAREPLYAEIASALHHCDALITLSSTGPAPEGLGWTGDPIFNGLWTFLGVPTITLPLMTVDDLPCGVTLVGKRRGEAKLFAVAKRFETMLS